VPSAADLIRAAIAANNGPIPFRQFMELALYSEAGFYSGDDNSGKAGRRGDFITSPEVGPLFGALLARMIDDEWKKAGSPDQFTVVDAGAGPGTLARTILAAQPQCAHALTYIAVETSSRQRALHPEGITSVEEMPKNIDTGVVIANELLDNLPFDLWVYDSGWRLAHVDMNGDQCVEVLHTAEVPSIFPDTAPHGTRLPWQHDAQQWLASTLSSLRSGRVVMIDYCTALTVELIGRPYREWLRTYVGHQRGAHYLQQPGVQDITTQVLIDQLSLVREPDAVRTQAQFLARWGIDELVDEGKRVWAEKAARPDLEAIRMRSRVSEAEALTDPAGLGAFSVCEWAVS
jgi:SAM-dependent MidA family methyltransferase